MTLDLAEVREKLANCIGTDDLVPLIDALGAVRTLLHGQGMTVQETAPILKLMGALADNLDGKPNALLPSRGNAGNSPGVVDVEVRAFVAAVVTLIARRPGVNLPRARAIVCKALDGAGLDSSKVKTWHHEIKYGRASPAACDAYRENLDRIGSMEGVDLEKGLVEVVRRAAKDL